MLDKIEILSVGLLDEQRSLVGELRQVARGLRLEFGWHYLLDLVWILKQLDLHPGLRVMDAGAGVGVIQWYLAEKGARVYSVDRTSRADLPLRFRVRYRVQGLRPGDLISTSTLLGQELARPGSVRVRFRRYGRDLTDMVPRSLAGRGEGRVFIYNQDLERLPHITDESLDAVVAVSALEHNEPEALERVVAELMRALKPGGLLLATLGAARERDWLHEPSHGWCYTEASLRRLFALEDGAPSNFESYDELMAALKDCAELRDNLARFYFQSGDNGMPWGEWAPQYQPAGVRKVKS